MNTDINVVDGREINIAKLEWNIWLLIISWKNRTLFHSRNKEINLQPTTKTYTSLLLCNYFSSQKIRIKVFEAMKNMHVRHITTIIKFLLKQKLQKNYWLLSFILTHVLLLNTKFHLIIIMGMNIQLITNTTIRLSPVETAYDKNLSSLLVYISPLIFFFKFKKVMSIYILTITVILQLWHCKVIYHTFLHMFSQWQKVL